MVGFSLFLFDFATYNIAGAGEHDVTCLEYPGSSLGKYKTGLVWYFPRRLFTWGLNRLPIEINVSSILSPSGSIKRNAFVAVPHVSQQKIPIRIQRLTFVPCMH